MSSSIAATPSSVRTTIDSAFWERLWRSAGIQSAVLFVLAALIYGQPHGGASADAFAVTHEGGSMRVQIAAVLAGVAILNLMWFAAAIRTTLAQAGKDGWGSAATAASATVGGLFFLLFALPAANASSIAISGDRALSSSLNDFARAGFVLSSFPRAMLIMAGSFGLWRAKFISNALFGIFVLAVVLVVAGGTTWRPVGYWSPDGVYSQLISPLICLAWLGATSGILLRRGPAEPSGW